MYKSLELLLFVLVNSEDENINLYNNQTHLEKRIFFLAPYSYFT